MSESWMRRDLKRFGVELLCLLMLLYGDPLRAPPLEPLPRVIRR